MQRQHHIQQSEFLYPSLGKIVDHPKDLTPNLRLKSKKNDPKIVSKFLIELNIRLKPSLLGHRSESRSHPDSLSVHDQ